MKTKSSRSSSLLMISPSVLLLLGWMLVPLCMTVYFSFLRYNLLQPGATPFSDWENYYWFITDPSFNAALINTSILVGGVLLITTIGGLGAANLLDKPMYGKGIIRIMFIAPFFVMPTVAALIWKNMFMNPVNGIFGHIAKIFGLQPIDFFGQIPLASIIFIVSWIWLPFATLILLTALQSLDQEQMEAAEIDGASKWNKFFYITLPHLARAYCCNFDPDNILLSIFAETGDDNGGPGTSTTTLTYLIYVSSLLQFDVGMGSAGGVIAIILANFVAIFLMRMIGKNLDT